MEKTVWGNAKDAAIAALGELIFTAESEANMEKTVWKNAQDAAITALGELILTADSEANKVVEKLQFTIDLKDSLLSKETELRHYHETVAGLERNRAENWMMGAVIAIIAFLATIGGVVFHAAGS